MMRSGDRHQAPINRPLVEQTVAHRPRRSLEIGRGRLRPERPNVDRFTRHIQVSFGVALGAKFAVRRERGCQRLHQSFLVF